MINPVYRGSGLPSTFSSFPRLTAQQVMRQQFRLAETQQELATRPTAELTQGRDPPEQNPVEVHEPRTIQDQKYFSAIDSFQEVFWLGRQDTISSLGLFSDMLEPGKSLDIPFANWLNTQTYDVAGYAPVEGADFVIMEFNSGGRLTTRFICTFSLFNLSERYPGL
jgi:hypothetical protein